MSPFCGEDTGEEEHLIQTVQEIKVALGKIISN